VVRLSDNGVDTKMELKGLNGRDEEAVRLKTQKTKTKKKKGGRNTLRKVGGLRHHKN